MKALNRAIHESGQAKAIQRRMLEVGDGNEAEVTLPGFHILSYDDNAKAASWALPGGVGDYEFTLGVYEEYVDRQLGKVWRPEDGARLAVGRDAALWAFPKSARATEWWSPLVKLIAMAFRDGTGELKHRGGWVALDLGEYRMEVTPTQVWSNFKGRMVDAAREASDATLSSVSTPPHSTPHPLAVALTEFDLPQSALWAANALFRAKPGFDAGNLDAFKRPHRLGKRSKGRVVALPDDVNEAFEILCEQAHSPSKDFTIRKLYGVAVPTVMPARVFVEVVGNPWRAGDQPLRSRAAARLRDYLAHL